MTADEEDDFALPYVPVDDNGYIIGPLVPVRRQELLHNARTSRPHGSIASTNCFSSYKLIPFFEYDANRLDGIKYATASRTATKQTRTPLVETG